MAKGLTNHQSTLVLFDPDTGRIKAVVTGNLLTALRTAAGSAVSIKYLARPDAQILAMVRVATSRPIRRAAVRMRKFDKVIGWNLHPEMLPRLADTAAELGLPFEAVDLPALRAQADAIVIIITSSFGPILLSDHMRPGIHLSCTGRTPRSKQEVEVALLPASACSPTRSSKSSWSASARRRGARIDRRQRPLGAVIAGLTLGRISPHEINLFDGMGVGLQDLAVAP